MELKNHLICQICKKELKNNRAISGHLKFHNILVKDYYDKYLKKDENEHICNNENCNNETNFINISYGYQKYCSSKCSNSSKDTKQKKECSYLKNYGVNHPSKSLAVQIKKQITCLEKYGVIHPSQSEEIKEKKKQTCLKNYGVTNPMKSPIVQKNYRRIFKEKYGCEYVMQNEVNKQKYRETLNVRYGEDNPSKVKKFQQKKEKTCLEKYGVTHPMKSKEIQEKKEKTCLIKYGTKSVFQVEKIKEKIRGKNIKKYGFYNVSKSEKIKKKKIETCLKNYGVKYPLQNEELLKKSQNTCFSHYNVYFPLQLKKIKNKVIYNSRKKFYDSLINSNRLKTLIKPNFDIELYKGYSFAYFWTCCKCNTVFESNIDDGKIPRCPKCFPPLNSTSKSEIEIFEFINSLNIAVENHNRKILDGKELDIFIPDFHLAIEMNGLYWHSEIGGTIFSDYHLNKTLKCQEKDIQLIHIFEDEWIEKQEIVKSIIKAKLGLIINKIPARKCIIQEINKNQAFNFLESNHLQGFINGTHLGLYFNNELVSVLTYGKPRFRHEYEIEIYRFCSKTDTIVMGGLSKLINYINSKSIISYVDLRYGTGKSYEKIGFKKLGQSKPNYFYTKNYKIRENRLKFQKHKLELILEQYDHNLTEWQNMQLNQFDRIWDCGNLILTFG